MKLSQRGVIHTLPLLVIIAAIGIISFLLITSTAPLSGGLFQTLNPKSQSHAATSGCVFSNGAQPAFCDTFDKPMGIWNRSGDLNGLIWGASRVGGDTQNPDLWDSWNYTPENQCGNTVIVHPEGDIHICNGQLIEAMNDGQDAKLIAMYPKQPFDFAGRTGTVVFDVSNNSEGPHAAWPEFWITDRPIPAPHGKQNPGAIDFSPNSIGISFAAGGDIGSCVGVDKILKTVNYVYTDLPFTNVGCVQKPTQFGQLNHYEIRISQNHVEIWGTDAGASTLKQIAVADNIALGFTRGLIWIDDVHYNGCKSGATQCVNTFAWDNVGFDGPYTYNDLAYDVPDGTRISNATVDYADETTGLNSGGQGLPEQVLGYFLPSNSSISFTIKNVVRSANATAGWIMLNFDPQSMVTINYSVNGHAHSQPWPFPDSDIFVRRSISLPVPASDLKDGDNVITLSAADGFVLSNIDLIEVAAGVPPCSINPSDPCFPSAVPTPTACPSCTPIPTPTTVPTSAPTPTPIPVSSGIVRDNTGGAYTDTLGNSWSADVGFSNGVTNSTTNTITNTSDPKLYQSERFGNFNYSYGVPNGNYNVTLKFAEIFWTAVGKRVFNVAINGNPVLTNFDIFQDAGAAFKADDKTFPVTVSNGTLTITFSSVTDNAKISSIQILPTSTQTPTSTPTATPSKTPTPTPTPVCPRGDLDGNCTVNIFDYNILVGNFGKTGTGVAGDIDGNGKVDIFDYNILVGNFGK